MEELAKIYSSREVEQKWYKNWEENGFFNPDRHFDSAQCPGSMPDDSKNNVFSIVIPPPNITGNLHMGHALNNTIQDVFVRFKRMQGFKTLWLPGTDHASIATENIVEKELKKQGTSKHQLGREKFLEKVWQWKEECGGNITRQLRRLGASCDWSRERFTMDEGCTRAVNHEFIELYKQGLIYRGKYLVNWCPKCHTAISDIEVVYEEKKGKLWYIKYLLENPKSKIQNPNKIPNPNNQKEFIVVATTRPETMLGDTAVAVNPKDKRFKHLIGKTIELPIVGRKIPIIADDFVDPKFGTGAVKVTPAHDTNDFEIGERHNLPRINILDSHARFVLPGEWQGLDRYKLRDKVVERLERDGFLEKIEDYENKVGECYRCKTVIEPYLSDQWYLKIKPLAEKAIKAVEEGKIKFVPDRWTKVYLNWMENLKDWCISRQLFWGHRIPVWYCKNRDQGIKRSRDQALGTLEPRNLETCDEIIVSETPPEKCPKCGGTELVQDEDVFDTWFSSALWPFSTLGWPENTEDLKTFYPTSVLVTGYDIITFWVSRMIMMGLHFMKERPFETVYIHGLVRDSSGRKMSKSLGNVVDPIKLVDEIGADALRFALASLVTGQGQDIKLAPEKLTEARNFANKIWNVSRFVLMNTKLQVISHKSQEKLAFEDKWILSRFNQTIDKVTSLLAEYDFGEGARVLYDFIWSEFCDWYVEFSKIRLYGQDEKAKQTVISVLSQVLEGILKLLHPYMPFITEEIYQRYQGIKVSRYQKETLEPLEPWNLGASIMLSPWPKVNKKQIDPKIDQQMALAMDVIRAIRNIRAEMSVSHSKNCDAVIVCREDKVLKSMEARIKNLAKVEKLEIVGKLKEKPQQAASSVIKNAEIYVPLAGLIDFEKEKERLNKAIDKVEKEKNEIEIRLNNKNFTDKAPKEKVEEAKTYLKQLQEELKLLSVRIVALK